MPSVTVGILTGETGRFSQFWVNMLGLDLPDGSQIITKRSIFVAEARNEIIRLSGHTDYVWFIDDDHTFEPDLLHNLLHRRVPIVQPLVLTRKSPFGPVMMPTEGSKPGTYKRAALDDAKTHGLVEMIAVGAGGMLIHRDVLNSVRDPWFETQTEDVNFCAKARAKGFKIYTDLSNRMGHMNVGTVTPVVKDGKWMTELTFGEGRIYLPAATKKEEPK